MAVLLLEVQGSSLVWVVYHQLPRFSFLLIPGIRVCALETTKSHRVEIDRVNVQSTTVTH